MADDKKKDEKKSCFGRWFMTLIPAMTQPEIGKKYWFPDFNETDSVAWLIWHGGEQYDKMLLHRGLLCETEDRAKMLANYLLRIAHQINPESEILQ